MMDVLARAIAERARELSRTQGEAMPSPEAAARLPEHLAASPWASTAALVRMLVEGRAAQKVLKGRSRAEVRNAIAELERTRKMIKDAEFASMLDRAAAGEAIPGLVIYWDASDSGNVGPAYRYRPDADPELEESGPLYVDSGRGCRGWTSLDAPEDVTGEFLDGINVEDYFDEDGYLGPDESGVHPLFAVA